MNDTQGPRLLLAPRPSSERNAPEFAAVIGSTPAILAVMFPCRFDAHVVAWRWARYLARYPK